MKKLNKGQMIALRIMLQQGDHYGALVDAILQAKFEPTWSVVETRGMDAVERRKLAISIADDILERLAD